MYLLRPLKCVAKAMKNSTRISYIFNLILIQASKDDSPSRFFALGKSAFARDVHMLGSESFILFRAICLSAYAKPFWW